MVNSTDSVTTGDWQFWVDRGGTFTDLVARKPDGSLVTHKLLSENPEQYEDAALQGIRDLLGLGKQDNIPAEKINAVKMGTTVATNALLERKGEPLLLVTTEGFRDSLRIGYQTRPKLFALHIELPEMLYRRVIEVEERIGAKGELIRPLNTKAARASLQEAYDTGLRACAIVFMHGYRYPDHEQQVAKIAKEIGFTQISTSHETSPLMKLVSRGDTTVVDAYLSPILRRYVDRVASELGDTRLMFMQSNGGLTDARFFQGKDAILSGPAGGVVGMVQTSAMAGFHKVIGFDMGGTSTDVSHYGGEYERTFETEVAGVRMRAPMMLINTVAAGGGSILHFDGARYKVGPDSAGANPGPACYRKGGPLTVTDCNVMLGKLAPEFFPKVFGPNADEPLDADIVGKKFVDLANKINAATGDNRTPEEVARGFLFIAVENMANAIKKISVQRGYDVSEYVLTSFGGAGGQHACMVADSLGMKKIMLHPYAGVLSAFGMGLADLRVLKEKAMEVALDTSALPGIASALDGLATDGHAEMRAQGVEEKRITIERKLHIKYQGSDTSMVVDDGELKDIITAFEAAHRQRFGFNTPEKTMIVEAVAVEVIGAGDRINDPERPETGATTAATPISERDIFVEDRWQSCPFYDRDTLPAGDCRKHGHHGDRARLAGGNDPSRPSCSLPRRGTQARPRDRHRGRSGDAGDFQQSLHECGRADGHRAGEDRLFGEYQGTTRFLLRGLRFER